MQLGYRSKPGSVTTSGGSGATDGTAEQTCGAARLCWKQKRRPRGRRFESRKFRDQPEGLTLIVGSIGVIGVVGGATVGGGAFTAGVVTGGAVTVTFVPAAALAP